MDAHQEVVTEPWGSVQGEARLPPGPVTTDRENNHVSPTCPASEVAWASLWQTPVLPGATRTGTHTPTHCLRLCNLTLLGRGFKDAQPLPGHQLLNGISGLVRPHAASSRSLASSKYDTGGVCCVPEVASLFSSVPGT